VTTLRDEELSFIYQMIHALSACLLFVLYVVRVHPVLYRHLVFVLNVEGGVGDLYT